jgi:hypothetical protein
MIKIVSFFALVYLLIMVRSAYTMSFLYIEAEILAVPLFCDVISDFVFFVSPLVHYSPLESHG